MVRTKKGQLTLLVIVGLVLLFSVFIIVSLQQAIVENRLQQQAEESVNDFIQVNSIEQYVTSCVNDVAIEGLHLLGKQGGVLYDYQGGLTSTKNFVEGRHYLPREYNISYAVGNNVFCPGASIRPTIVNLSDSTTADYPVKGIFFDDYQDIYTYYFKSNFPGCNGINERVSSLSGYLGSNQLPKLCSYNGSNAYDGEQATCAFQYYDNSQDPTSIQRQLETYVTNNLGKCVNFSYYENEIAGYNITLNEQNVEVSTVLQTPRGIRVEAQYPFTVNIPGSQALYEARTFQTQIDINIRNLYDFMFRSLFNHLRDPYFQLIRDQNKTRSWTASLSVERLKNACTDCVSPRVVTDDVLIFRDSTTQLRGDEFYFQVASKQRKPVLDYMHDPTQTNVFNNNLVNYVFLSNSTIQFFPNATDPDEDTIRFTYLGWGENYTEYFNYTRCQKEKCSLSTHKQYMSRTYDQPKKLSSSPFFDSTKQAVGRIKTNNTDIGYHEITILIEDEHGNKDFQNVSFLIFDMPIARLNGSNMYEDINNSYASVEDLYTLDGSASTASLLFDGQGLSSYVFSDLIEGFTLDSPHNIVILSEPVTFSNVTNAIFDSDQNVPSDHQITLTVFQEDTTGSNRLSSTPSAIDVKVANCLPHGYNITTGLYAPGDSSNSRNANNYWNENDPFDQPNVCCEPTKPLTQPLQGGTIRDSTRTCFDTSRLSTTLQTCFPFNGESFYANRANVDVAKDDIRKLTRKNYEDANYNYKQDLFKGIEYEVKKTNKDINDIFTVQQTQQCSGLRGNSCGGKLSISWTTDKACADLDDVPGQFARCQGPGTTSAVGKSFCVGSNLNGRGQCINYTSGDSFEKDFLQISSENDYGYGNDVIEIQKGLCGPPRPASLNFTGTVRVDTGKNIVQEESIERLSCEATCSLGSCNYTEISQCSCNVQGSVCDSISASQFVGRNNQEQYYCKGTTACTADCLAQKNNPITTKAACQCAQPGSGGKSFDESGSVREFFDIYAYKRNNENNPTDQLCCTGSTSLTTLSPKTGALTCLEGSVKTSGTLSKLGTILSCDGQLLGCKSNYGVAGVVSRSERSSACSFTCTAQGTWQ